MGSYCQLYIAEYPVFSSKSYVSPAVMTMFREGDKALFRRRFSERNQVEWGHVEPDDEDFETAVEYRAKVKDLRQRLDIIGFSLARVRSEFEEVKSAKIEKLKEWPKDDDDPLWDDTIKVLEGNSFEDYMAAYKDILSSKIHPVYYLEKNENASELIEYMLKDNDEFFWGFPCLDLRCFFRVLLEIAPSESEAVQDISDLVSSGYYAETDEVCHIALEEIIGDYAVNSKIIVLTEGSTDTEFLSQSMKLLYPHLYDYYTFMDFGFKPPGGVGPLVNAVKSFSGAGIENRVIALFDNDTAAFSAVESLKNIAIPNNIVITHYPDITLADSYPALGPNGMSLQNINGLACGIELYLGKDVLEKDGELIPIQWKGFDSRISQYQGEILEKAEIQERFRQKVSKCSQDRNNIQLTKWEELHHLFQHVFGVFHA
ncbi:hypothetical protein L1D34_28635 [Vibrio mediterranei]|uniref:HEPN/Toprim-associated domain-containing protein n=1 Tax=Vibrio mediterranei TaxID=689 RepID=UPI001EFCBFAC|nr:HEPN/Toprim-associated domain-containing protein [Vibrio mediterranei]MCG9628777.1 hypothetical protein [Vibrio mediterranei]